MSPLHRFSKIAWATILHNKPVFSIFSESPRCPIISSPIMGYLRVTWQSTLLLCLMIWAASSTPLPRLLMISSDAGVPSPQVIHGEINNECWETASRAIIHSRKLPVSESVDSLQDFLTQLRSSRQSKHKDLFVDLAQTFWGKYVDCVLARAHGLGKRLSLIAGESREAN